MSPEKQLSILLSSTFSKTAEFRTLYGIVNKLESELGGYQQYLYEPNDEDTFDMWEVAGLIDSNMYKALKRLDNYSKNDAYMNMDERGRIKSMSADLAEYDTRLLFPMAIEKAREEILGGYIDLSEFIQNDEWIVQESVKPIKKISALENRRRAVTRSIIESFVLNDEEDDIPEPVVPDEFFYSVEYWGLDEESGKEMPMFKVGWFTKDSGKWQQENGRMYMSYLTTTQLLNWVTKDYGDDATVKGPFDTEVEAEESRWDNDKRIY